MTSDESLMLQFQGGSRDAFEELFERYRDPLYGFFRRRLNYRERAEDLTQEVFLIVIRSRIRYEPRALFRTYLYGIALKLISGERRRQAKLDHSPPSEQDSSIGPLADAAIWVHQAVNRLEPVEREILMLREYEQLSYTEIAGLLHLPLNTVRSRLFRARMALKNHLAPEEKAGDLCK
jgi:RNA polymerase sigma-70 factor (ECF subfamily)